MFGKWNDDGMSLTFFMLADGIMEEKQVLFFLFSSAISFLLVLSS